MAFLAAVISLDPAYRVPLVRQSGLEARIIRWRKWLCARMGRQPVFPSTRATAQADYYSWYVDLADFNA